MKTKYPQPKKQDVIDALKALQEAFVHIPGNVKGNKAKTDVIRFNPDMQDALNQARNVMLYGHK